MRKLLAFLLLVPSLAMATSSHAPQACYLYDALGNALSSTAGALNVSGGAGGGGNAAAGLTGAAVPTSADYTGFSSAGNLVGVSSVNPLPVSVGNFPANQAITVDGAKTTAATMPAGGSGAIGWLSAIFNALVNTLTVTISGTPAVTQSGTWVVQPGNTANTTAWKVDGSAVTQPMSAASLPLPTGASTSANQTTTNSSLASIASGATSAMTQVAASATSVTAKAANANRRGLLLANESTSVCYLAFGATASAAAYTVRLDSHVTYTLDLPIYTGVVSAIWASATGSLQVTEITP